MVTVKFKKFSPDAPIPSRAYKGDAGWDLTAVYYYTEGNIVVYHTGIAVEIPEGYVGLVFPRSSIKRVNLDLSNSVGVIDSGYRGEITAVFRRTATVDGMPPVVYQVGERIAQLVIVKLPDVRFEEVDVLSESERGKSGYGSSGK